MKKSELKQLIREAIKEQSYNSNKWFTVIHGLSAGDKKRSCNIMVDDNEEDAIWQRREALRAGWDCSYIGDDIEQAASEASKLKNKGYVLDEKSRHIVDGDRYKIFEEATTNKTRSELEKRKYEIERELAQMGHFSFAPDLSIMKKLKNERLQIIDKLKNLKETIKEYDSKGKFSVKELENYMRENYSYISFDESERQIQNFLNQKYLQSISSIERIADLYADYLLSQGRADVQESMKKSTSKQFIKKIIKEEANLPEQSPAMDKLYKDYQNNGLDNLKFDDAAMNEVDSNFVRNFYGYKKLRNSLVKFIELYGRTNDVK